MDDSRTSSGEGVRHSATETLFTHWKSLGDGRCVPPRARLSPAGISAILPQVFILEADGDAAGNFRLAGGNVCDLHMRELRGTRFKDLFAYTSRMKLESAMRRVLSGAALVMRTTVRSDMGFAELETALLPMRSGDGAPDRIVGCMAPTTSAQSLSWVGSRPVSRHDIVEIVELEWRDGSDVIVDERLNPSPLDASVLDFTRRGRAPEGRRVGHLVVLEGGARD